MKTIALDIETIPNEAMIELLPEPEIAIGNIKDTAKIEAKRHEAKRKQVDEMAIRPETGMICSYAFYGDGVNETRQLENISAADEILLINDIFDMIKVGKDPALIVTHNGIEFDFPYIYKRALINNIDIDDFKPYHVPPLTYWTIRYNTLDHCDILKVWNNWSNNTKNSSLNYLSQLLLGDRKTKRDYSQYLQYIKDGKQSVIAEDNRCDAILTYQLYKKFKGFLF